MSHRRRVCPPDTLLPVLCALFTFLVLAKPGTSQAAGTAGYTAFNRVVVHDGDGRLFTTRDQILLNGNVAVLETTLTPRLGLGFIEVECAMRIQVALELDVGAGVRGRIVEDEVFSVGGLPPIPVSRDEFVQPSMTLRWTVDTDAQDLRFSTVREFTHVVRIRRNLKLNVGLDVIVDSILNMEELEPVSSDLVVSADGAMKIDEVSPPSVSGASETRLGVEAQVVLVLGDVSPDVTSDGILDFASAIDVWTTKTHGYTHLSARSASDWDISTGFRTDKGNPGLFPSSWTTMRVAHDRQPVLDSTTVAAQPIRADDVRWSRRYDHGDLDIPKKIVASVDRSNPGGLVVASSMGNAGRLTEVTPDGTERWSTEYVGSPFADLVATGSGYLGCGQTNGGKIFVSVLSSAGVVTSRWIVDGPGSNYCDRVDEHPSGGVVVIGRATKAGQQVPYVARLDGTGALLWAKSYSYLSGSISMNDGIVTSTGIVLVGEHDGDDPHLNAVQNGYVLQLDLDGVPVWERTLGQRSGSTFHAVAQTRDGDLIAVGRWEDGKRLWAVSLDSSGAVNWSQHLDDLQETSQDWDKGVAVHARSGAIYISGDGGKATEHEAWLFRLNDDGEVQWFRTAQRFAHTGASMGISPYETELGALYIDEYRVVAAGQEPGRNGFRILAGATDAMQHFALVSGWRMRADDLYVEALLPVIETELSMSTDETAATVID